MKTIGFIGGGRVTRIFLQAFSNAGMALDQVAVYDPNREVLDALKHRFPSISINSIDLQKVIKADLVFLAVHPPVMMETLSTIKAGINPAATVVSLAPKFTIEKIRAALGDLRNIARINPSASSYINKGVNPICFAPSMDEGKKSLLLDLIEPLGYSPEVDEPKIEAYAMISAMGHTYFWFQLQKLKEFALSFGMDADEAETVISQMMHGTVETLFRSGLAYAEVVDLVPVKPLGPVENTINGFYDNHLVPLFNKIKP